MLFHSKYFRLFFKIVLILAILTILLPQVIDHLIKILLIEKFDTKPKGNSTFVTNPMTMPKNSVKENFFTFIECFIN